MRGAKKLTKSVIDGLGPDPSGRDIIHWDSEISRFGVRVKPSGVKSYVLQYRNKFGQPRRYTIARVDDMTAAKARERALVLRGMIAAGGDPSAEKKADRQAQTVWQLCEDYLETAQDRLKPNSLKTNRSGLVHHVKPLLGSVPVATVTPAMIEKFARDVAEGKTARKFLADGKGHHGGVVKGGKAATFRILAVLGTVLQRAVRDGVLKTNPVAEIDRARHQPKRPPPFSFDTIERLGKALREREDAGERASGLRAIRFLLLSGCRRMEALTLRWGMIDSKARCLRLPDTKTGPAMRPLGRSAIEFLDSFRPDGAKPDDYVFPGNSAAGHFNDLPRVWEKVCKAAHISGASIHTLRHWYASCGAELNVSELLIAGLIGHKIRSVTGRYASAPDSALLSAADRVSLRLTQALIGMETGAKVVSIA